MHFLHTAINNHLFKPQLKHLMYPTCRTPTENNAVRHSTILYTNATLRVLYGCMCSSYSGTYVYEYYSLVECDSVQFQNYLPKCTASNPVRSKDSDIRFNAVRTVITLTKYPINKLHTTETPPYKITFVHQPKSPRISLNRKVHCRLRNSPPLAPALTHINTVHSIPSYCFKLYLVLFSHLQLRVSGSTFPSTTKLHKSDRPFNEHLNTDRQTVYVIKLIFRQFSSNL